MALQVKIMIIACFMASALGAVSWPSNCFFGTHKTADGVWWLVDPAGKPFISKGVVASTYMADQSLVSGTYPYYDNIKSVHATEESWANATLKRFSEWGFNTAGAWSSTRFASEMPYVLLLDLAAKAGADWLNGGMADYFSTEFFDSVYATARDACGPLRGDTNLIGYMFDNELRWGPDWRSTEQILIAFLAFNATSPGRKRAEQFLQQRYGDITTLETRWGVTKGTYKVWSDIKTINTANTEQLAAAYDWAGVAAQQYLSVAHSAVLLADPNHLTLGMRISGGAPEPVLRQMVEYSDVFSLNIYARFTEQTYLNTLYSQTSLPLMITEFSFKAADSGLGNKGGGDAVATQVERAAQLDEFVRTIISHPASVGYHWFKHVDQPLGGRMQDGEDSNFGLVSITDVPYTGVVSTFVSLNSQVERLHTPAAQEVPTSLPSKCVANVACYANCSGNGCCDKTIGVCTCFAGYGKFDCSINMAKWTDSFVLAPDASKYWTFNGFDANGLSAVSSRFSLTGSALKLTVGQWQFSGMVTYEKYPIGRYGMLASVGYAAGAFLELVYSSAPTDSVYRAAHLRVQGGPSTSKLAGFYYTAGTATPQQFNLALSFDASVAFHLYEMWINPAAGTITYYVDGTAVGSISDSRITTNLLRIQVASGGFKTDGGVFGTNAQASEATMLVKSLSFQQLPEPARGMCATTSTTSTTSSTTAASTSSTTTAATSTSAVATTTGTSTGSALSGCPESCNYNGCCNGAVCSCFPGFSGATCTTGGSQAWIDTFKSGQAVNLTKYWVLTGYSDSDGLSALNTRWVLGTTALQLTMSAFEFSGMVTYAKVPLGRYGVVAKVSYAAGAFLEFQYQSAPADEYRSVKLRVQGGPNSKLVGFFYTAGVASAKPLVVSLSFDAAVDYHLYEFSVDPTLTTVTYMVDRVVVGKLVDSRITAGLLRIQVAAYGLKSSSDFGSLTSGSTAVMYVKSISFVASSTAALSRSCVSLGSTSTTTSTSTTASRPSPSVPLNPASKMSASAAATGILLLLCLIV